MPYHYFIRFYALPYHKIDPVLKHMIKIKKIKIKSQTTLFTCYQSGDWSKTFLDDMSKGVTSSSRS